MLKCNDANRGEGSGTDDGVDSGAVDSDSGGGGSGVSNNGKGDI